MMAAGNREKSTRARALNAFALLALVLAAVTAGIAAEQQGTGAGKSDAARPPELIWRDTGDPASLDMTYGAGGKAHAPDPEGTFTFVKEDLNATSPKFIATDGQGAEWKIKLGEESRPETAATRLLWAAGYFTDEDYYMADLTVKGLTSLSRGEEFVSPGGTVHGARLERKLAGVKKLGNWDWFDNPFLGQREFNGLRVMMSLLNNWDLKTINNSIYAENGERHFIVTDVGATFGNTGNTLTRSKSDPKAYAASPFIDGATPEFVNLALHSRPFFLWAVDVPNYRARTRMEQITQRVPRADAAWLALRLSKLSEEQIRDCFRAAGYSTEDVDVYTQVVRKRIAELGAL